MADSIVAAHFDHEASAVTDQIYQRAEVFLFDSRIRRRRTPGVISGALCAI